MKAQTTRHACSPPSEIDSSEEGQKPLLAENPLCPAASYGPQVVGQVARMQSVAKLYSTAPVG